MGFPAESPGKESDPAGSGSSSTTVSNEQQIPRDLWTVAVEHLERSPEQYWAILDNDWHVQAAGKTLVQEVLQRSVGPSLTFLDLVTPGLREELRDRRRTGELESGEIELLHPIRTGTRTVAYRFYRIKDGWLLFGRDQSSQIELVSQMSVLIEDLEQEMQRERALADRLRSLLSNDHLTGLANRRHFDEVLKSRWESYVASEQPFSVITLDIDHFKPVNDRWGHAVGDEVLKLVAKAVGTSIRGGDKAARVGGDEFVVLATHTTMVEARRIADRIRTRLQVTSMPQGVGQLTVSAGIASTDPFAPSSAQELLDLADSALYRAKNLGRNRVEAPGEPGE